MSPLQRDRLARLADVTTDCVDAGIDGEDIMSAVSEAVRRVGKPARTRRCNHPLADSTCDGRRHNHATDLDWKPGQPWDD